MSKHMHDEDGPHPICAQLRALRRAAGLSLAAVEERYGIPAVVVGSYERGDRQPGVNRLAHVLALYGYELRAVPTGARVVADPTAVNDGLVLTGEHMVAALRMIASQLEAAHRPPAAVATPVDDVPARVGAQRAGS